MAALLTTASKLTCPHGGTVAIAPGSPGVTAGGPLALATDSYTISGCSWQIVVGTGTVPHPCVTVQWSQVNTKTTVNGVPTLSLDSKGLCLAADQVPQGNVAIVSTQPGVSGD
jgi:hypothetical protein